jgi:SAM-dependent methyltransferase
MSYHISQSQKERSQSYFYGMRKFHNYIKRTLYDTYTKNIDSIMELAVGKFGDMNKVISNNIKYVVGYDIDYASIEEGKRRMNEARLSTKGNFPKVELYVKDLSRNIVDGKNEFDVISSQFAFHYFMESEETFNTILETIKLNIKPGGIFMGTMFDGDSLLNLRKNDSDILELSDKGEVRFRLKFGKVNDTLFGNKVSVFLKDTVLDEPMEEYIVNFKLFVKLMRENGFELIDSKMFYELSQDKFKLNNVSKTVSFLNRTFAFKKIEEKIEEEIEEKIEEKTQEKQSNMCNQENDYLIECDWVETIQTQTLEKYKKALNNKINITNNERSRNDYIFIRDNFEDIENVLEKANISDGAKKYFFTIYKMYLKEIQIK